MILDGVEEAVGAGAQLEKACALVGVTPRTLSRWRAANGGEDGRAGAGVSPAHKLSDEERRRVLEAAHGPEFRDLSPRQIVPLLADRDEYIASESTFYRVLREAGELTHRGRARPAKSKKPQEHIARRPNQVWSWDITYLRSRVRGVFYYLYMAVDVYSRKLVGWRVEAEELGSHAAALITAATEAEAVPRSQLVLHADNGGPMKASTMLATLQRLGVVASFSRPSVSDDNPYAEALFRTLKYRPGFPSKPFESIEAARAWVADFVRWYNDEHLHSAIRYVRPSDRHAGRDAAILTARDTLYRRAKARTPRRWTHGTRNWAPIGPVYLNPIRHEVRVPPIAIPVSS